MSNDANAGSVWLWPGLSVSSSPRDTAKSGSAGRPVPALPYIRTRPLPAPAVTVSTVRRPDRSIVPPSARMSTISSWLRTTAMFVTPDRSITPPPVAWIVLRTWAPPFPNVRVRTLERFSTAPDPVAENTVSCATRSLSYDVDAIPPSTAPAETERRELLNWAMAPVLKLCPCASEITLFSRFTMFGVASVAPDCIDSVVFLSSSKPGALSVPAGPMLIVPLTVSESRLDPPSTAPVPIVSPLRVSPAGVPDPKLTFAPVGRTTR